FRLALFAGLIFAVHPLLTESVTYIAGRSSSLCATFYFATLLLAILAGNERGPRQGILMLMSAVCAALSWLVKQDAVTLPLAVSAIAILAWPDKVPIRRRITVVVSCLIILVVVLTAQRRSIAAVTATSQANDALMAAGFEQTLPFAPFALTSIKEFTTYY